MSESQGQVGAAGLPEDADLWLFEGFDTINSKPSRTAIGDKEMFWCKNLMPLGDNNLRAMWSNTTSYYYTAAGGRTITHFWFFNINNINCFLARLDDGSANIVNADTKANIATFPAGTLAATHNFTQWGNQFLIIIGSQTNGFFVWDGTTLFTAGALGPIPQLDNVGNGYASAPVVTAYGGSGSGATFTATVVGNQVTEVKVTNPGTGYTVNDVVGLKFTGGGGGNTAVLLATLDAGGQVNGIAVSVSGKGYTSSAKLQFVGGGGTGAQATPILQGKVGSVVVTNGGIGYTSAPTVAITGSGGSGSGATATVNVDTGSGQVTSIDMTAYGSGYQSPLTVTFTGGGSGTGFAAAQAQANLVGATMVGVNITNAGSDYVTAPTVLVVDPLGTMAQGTVSPMPFGISGTDVEVYESRIWIINGDKVYFTSPGNPSDFDVGNGAGAFRSTDGFLKTQFVSLMAGEGFLYLFGDSSTNAISGVNTTGNPPITTFTNQNLDPQVGTTWHHSVKAYARAMMLANPYGIHALYGGAIQKVSTPMDGIFDFSGSLTTPGFEPSAALAQIFGVKVYMILLPIYDIFAGTITNHLVLWDGKRWWVANQLNGLTYITEQVINSTINAFGTDGTHIFKLFEAPSGAIRKSVQSKLWTKPNYMMKKRLTRFAGLYQNRINESLVVNVAFDYESGFGNFAYTQVLPFLNPLAIQSAVQTCDAAGFALGFSLFSDNQDFTLVSFSAVGQKYEWLV